MKTILFLTTVFLTANVYACPTIKGVPDFNCDGELKVVVLGDSLAYGFGDTALNNKGGWVSRSASKLPQIDFSNFGKQGLRTKELLTQIDRALNKNKDVRLQEALLTADIVVLDIGRNDRWLFGAPLASYRNIKRAGTVIKNVVKREAGLAPIIVTAVLMLPNRGSQGPWVKELNSIILRGNTSTDPSDLRFDLVSKRLLSMDQIHPTSKGYIELAKTFITYLTTKLPSKMRALRPDTDGDGLPDIIETVKFHTLTDNPDTDGDGKLDGEEIFTYATDPLVAD